MKVVSVNVGTPKQVQVGNQIILTSIWKAPVPGRVSVRRHNIEGDQQADLSVHGGPQKAVYSYAREHYDYWRVQLPDADFVPGNFGENLTTLGMSEDIVCIGDHYRVGSAVLQVTQPRMPCFKLGVRFGRADMVKRFWHARRPGIYFSIVEEGEVAADDPIELVETSADGISLADVVALYTGAKTSPDLVERALRAPLFGRWKEGIRERAAAESL